MEQKYSDTSQYKEQLVELERLKKKKRLRDLQAQSDSDKPTVLSTFGRSLERQSERMTHGVEDAYLAMRNVLKAPFSDEEYPGFFESQYGPERTAIAEYERQANAKMAPHYETNPISSMIGQSAYFAPLASVSTPAQAVGAGASLGLADYGSTPQADAIGGMLGFKAGESINKLTKNLLNKQPQPPTVNRAIKEGFELTPAKRIKSDGLEKFELSAESTPYLTGIMNRPQINNQDLLNMQYLQEIGFKNVKKGTKITTDLIDEADTMLSKEYDKALKGVTIKTDKQFISDLRTILSRDIDVPVKSPDVKQIVRNIVDGFDNGTMTGNRYQNFRSNLLQTSKNVFNSPSNAQPGYAPALSDLVNAMDNLAERNMPNSGMKALNRKYRMFKTGTEGVVPAVNVDKGNVSAPKLRNKLNKQGKAYKQGRDKSPIFDTLHALNEFSSSVGNSGSAERMFIQNVMQGDISQNLANIVLGNTAGRLYGGKLNPMGRLNINPKMQKAGTVLGVGANPVENLLKLLLGEEYAE